MPTTDWKGRDEVRRLKVSGRLIGEGYYAHVYTGKLWFKGKKPIPVAVKQFKRPLDDDGVKDYETAIDKLRKAGAPMLKVGFVKHEGNWVQVMERFRTSTRKLLPLFPEGARHRAAIRSRIRDKHIEGILQTVAGIVNAGYAPFRDSIGVTLTKKDAHFLVHDLDGLAVQERTSKEPIYRLDPGSFEPNRINITREHIRDITARLSKMTNTPIVEVIARLKEKVTHQMGLAAIEQLEREMK